MSLSFTETKLVGNLLDVRQAGQNKVLVLSQYQSSKDYTEAPMDIMSFARSAEEVAQLEAALAEVRKQAGNDTAALKNVQVIARVEPQVDEKGYSTGYQLQLNKVLSANGQAIEVAAAAK